MSDNNQKVNSGEIITELRDLPLIRVNRSVNITYQVSMKPLESVESWKFPGNQR